MRTARGEQLPLSDKFFAPRRQRMGCRASKEAGDPGPPPHLQAATARTVRLLESLAGKEERVEWPVLPISVLSRVSK